MPISHRDGPGSPQSPVLCSGVSHRHGTTLGGEDPSRCSSPPSSQFSSRLRGRAEPWSAAPRASWPATPPSPANAGAAAAAPPPAAPAASCKRVGATVRVGHGGRATGDSRLTATYQRHQTAAHPPRHHGGYRGISPPWRSPLSPGNWWHLEGDPNAWAGRKGHAPLEAAEASRTLFCLVKRGPCRALPGTPAAQAETRGAVSGSPPGASPGAQQVAAGWPSGVCWHTAARRALCPHPAPGTSSAAPRQVPAAHELHFLGPPSVPPPGGSCRKHGPVPAAAGAGNLSAFAGVLKSRSKIGHGLNLPNFPAGV